MRPPSFWGTGIFQWWPVFSQGTFKEIPFVLAAAVFSIMQSSHTKKNNYMTIYIYNTHSSFGNGRTFSARMGWENFSLEKKMATRLPCWHDTQWLFQCFLPGFDRGYLELKEQYPLSLSLDKGRRKPSWYLNLTWNLGKNGKAHASNSIRCWTFKLLQAEILTQWSCDPETLGLQFSWQSLLGWWEQQSKRGRSHLWEKIQN